MFIGHLAAAEGRLRLVSIASSAARNHLMVYDDLEDVPKKLAYAAQNDPAQLAVGSEYLFELLPDRWAASHPELVCKGRIDKNKRVFEKKRARRAAQRIAARRKARALA